MSMLLQQAFQQAMPLRQRNWISADPSSICGTTGLVGNGDSSMSLSIFNVSENYGFANSAFPKRTPAVTALETDCIQAHQKKAGRPFAARGARRLPTNCAT